MTRQRIIPGCLVAAAAIIIILSAVFLQLRRNSDADAAADTPQVEADFTQEEILKNDTLQLQLMTGTGCALQGTELTDSQQETLWTFIQELSWKENFERDVVDGGVQAQIMFTIDTKAWRIRLRSADNIEIQRRTADGSENESSVWIRNGKESGSRYTVNEEAFTAILEMLQQAGNSTEQG